MRPPSVRYSAYLWLSVSVNYCFSWLFCPFPNALFYTVALSDSITYCILWQFGACSKVVTESDNLCSPFYYPSRPLHKRFFHPTESSEKENWRETERDRGRKRIGEGREREMRKKRQDGEISWQHRWMRDKGQTGEREEGMRDREAGRPSERTMPCPFNRESQICPLGAGFFHSQ